MSEGLGQDYSIRCAVERCNGRVIGRHDVLCPSCWTHVPAVLQGAVVAARLTCNPSDRTSNDPWSDAMARVLADLHARYPVAKWALDAAKRQLADATEKGRVMP